MKILPNGNDCEMLFRFSIWQSCGAPGSRRLSLSKSCLLHRPFNKFVYGLSSERLEQEPVRRTKYIIFRKKNVIHLFPFFFSLRSSSSIELQGLEDNLAAIACLYGRKFLSVSNISKTELFFFPCNCCFIFGNCIFFRAFLAKDCPKRVGKSLIMHEHLGIMHSS